MGGGLSRTCAKGDLPRLLVLGRAIFDQTPDLLRLGYWQLLGRLHAEGSSVSLRPDEKRPSRCTLSGFALARLRV